MVSCLQYFCQQYSIYKFLVLLVVYKDFKNNLDIVQRKFLTYKNIIVLKQLYLLNKSTIKINYNNWKNMFDYTFTHKILKCYLLSNDKNKVLKVRIIKNYRIGI